jgi:hypothetical protein
MASACAERNLLLPPGIIHRYQDKITQLNGRTCLLPDGSERFLVDEPLLMRTTDQLNARLLDPIKTTVVQNQRSMTTWVLQKNMR